MKSWPIDRCPWLSCLNGGRWSRGGERDQSRDNLPANSQAVWDAGAPRLRSIFPRLSFLFVAPFIVASLCLETPFAGPLPAGNVLDGAA